MAFKKKEPVPKVEPKKPAFEEEDSPVKPKSQASPSHQVAVPKKVQNEPVKMPAQKKKGLFDDD